MMQGKDMWSLPSGTAGNSGGRQVMANSNSYAFMASGMQMQGASGMLSVAPPHDRSQEICKYFINGGCLRGAACPYLHELPDERHLDVNGLGFILNPNVHNAQKTVSSPQSNVGGANSAVGQLSPTSTGSPLALGLGGQGGASRQFQFGHSNTSGTVHANKATTSGKQQHYSTVVTQPVASVPLSAMKQPPKYRPPEPYLEHNLPPALALPLKANHKDSAQALTMTLLQS